ncbi:MAG TPA: lytic murein transglycosylase [Patescibacteria group bacterium]|nr:lytic murein transglycosylase [Patescibacteria group bacterium]
MAFTLAVVCGQVFAAAPAEASQHHRTHHAAKAKAHGKHVAKSHKHHAAAPANLSDREWTQIQDRFDNWLPEFRQRALAAGISQHTIDEALGNIKPIRTVVELDRRQPESIMSFRDYAQRAVDPRVAQGREMMRRYATELHEVEQQYGVPAEYIVALWGMETNYGTYQGDFNVPSALATLAVEGRRRDFFTQELMDALRLIDRGDVSAADMKGSWAGAMGNNQFMPSTLLKYGADGDGDGKVNIWSRDHLRDTFASSANKLVHDDWRPGERWGREVHLPEHFPKALINSGTISPIATWKGLGITLANGHQLPLDESAAASLVAPGASRPNYPGGPVFLAYNNYRTLAAWNAGYFPAAIGLLADRIRLPEPSVATQ